MEWGEGRQTPRCVDCQADLTVKHILVECHNFNQERRAASLDGRSLGEVLGDEADIFNLMDFLKKIDIFYKI